MKLSIWKGQSATSIAGSVSYSMESIDADTAEVVNPTSGETIDLDAGSAENMELAQEVAVLSAEVDEIQHAVTAADNGEQIADVAQAVADRGDASKEEGALIQAGMAQTLQATGAPEEVVDAAANSVAQESHNGSVTVSIESISDWLRKIWQSIKDFVANVVETITNAWSRFWNSTARLKKKAEELKKKAEKDYKTEKKNKDDKIESWYGWMTGLSDSAKISFGSPVDALARFRVYSKVASQAGAPVKSLVKDLQGQVKSFADKGIDKADLGKLQKNLETILDAYGTSKPADSVGSGKVGRAIVPGLGNFALVYSHNDLSRVSEDDYPTFVNSITVSSGRAQKHFEPKVKEPKFEPLTHGNVLGTCDAVIELCNNLDDWFNKGSKTAKEDISKLRGEIDKAMEKADEKADGQEKAKWRTVARLFVIPTQVLRGSMQLCAHLVQTGEHAISMAKNSLSFYDEKD